MVLAKQNRALGTTENNREQDFQHKERQNGCLALAISYADPVIKGNNNASFRTSLRIPFFKETES